MSFDSAQFLRNPIRMDRSDLMMPQIGSEISSQPVEKGFLGGLEFTVVSDPALELQDSMEELSMMFEEKSAKKLSDRTLGETRRRTSPYVEALNAWMKAMPDMPNKERIDELWQMLRQAARDGGLPRPGELKEFLSRLSSDPSHQFAILDVLEQAAGPEETSLRSLLSATRGELLAERGSDIKAGINLATEVNARATTPEEMSNLRNLYRSEILGFTSPQDCFRSILSSRGAGALSSAIEFLRAGCGADLSSGDPSQDPVALRRIMLDLQCVNVLQTVLDSMSGLSSRMLIQYGLTLKQSSESMTGTIISYTEKGIVRESELSQFESDCGIKNLLARMDFARELVGIFRRLSSRLFELEDDRLRLIEVGEEHLDGIISLENEANDDDNEEKEKR